MPPEPPPWWRQAYDAAEREVSPRLESLVRTSLFARGAALATRAQALARAQAQGTAAQVWHLLNLPAGTDVGHLRAQVGALDREVRRLTLALERERARTDATDTAREPHDAGPTGPDRDPAPGAPRRRPQRPPRP